MARRVVRDYGERAEELYAETAGDAVFVRDYGDEADEFVVNDWYLTSLVESIPRGPNGFHGIAYRYHYVGLGPWVKEPWLVDNIDLLLDDLLSIPDTELIACASGERLLVIRRELVGFLREASEAAARVHVEGRSA